MMNEHSLPPANVIRSLLQHPHELSIFTHDMPIALKAEVAELNQETGFMVLEVEYGGADIGQYLANGMVNFDLEAFKGSEHSERETYSLSHITAKLLKTDAMLYRLECQLPDSVFATEKRGETRIPFILGMRARASIEVYRHVLNVPGQVRNLSVGGCMAEIDLAESIALTEGQSVPGVVLEFPDGQRFYTEGSIRHIRPFGNHGHAAVGIQFIGMSAYQNEMLIHYVNEAEREAAFRAGLTGRMVYQSSLFAVGSKEKAILQHESHLREKHERQTPMERGVMEVAHQIQVGLMYIKTHHVVPQEIFYDCADTLIYLVRADRKNLLYALSFLRDEPDWLRHAVEVAARLAEMMLKRDPHDLQVREAVLGALLHTMGKPLLVSENLPSLKITMNPTQKEILKHHVAALCETLHSAGWEPGPVCRDIIENANEHLDGTGYPLGKKKEQISELVRLISVIKAIDKLMHARNGIPGRTPMEAYRIIYESGKTYDNKMLVRYVQRYGFYPIGCLAKYSGGFLGWIMDVNNKGAPVKVHLVKNLRFPDTTISSIVSDSDLYQVGKLEGIVCPSDFGMTVIKI
ncbi:HD domain-containing phosphohydrolase [Pseudomonas graminis]